MIRIGPAFCALAAGFAGVWIATAQPSPRPGAGLPIAQPETVAALLDSLSGNSPDWVERDQQGRVVKLRLVSPWCNDRNIALVAQINELRELTLQGGKATAQGVRLLRGNTNLYSLQLACFFDLPSGMLSEVSTFSQLKELRLLGLGAISSEYASLVSLTNLADLHITSDRAFGDADLARLTNLPSLKNLVVSSQSLTSKSAVLLPQFRALTNVELEGLTERKFWSTNWHSPTRAVHGQSQGR